MSFLLLFLLVFLHFSSSSGDGQQAPLTVQVEAVTQNYVFAHFMIGIVSNRQSSSDYDADMKLAKSFGIDAFALNIGTDSFTDTQLTYAYQSANAFGMKVFISFDCSYYGPGSEGTIGARIARFGKQPAQLLVDNKVFVSTFVGDGLNVASIKNAAGMPVYFAPNYHPGMADFGPLDGAFNWMGWQSNGRNKAPTGPGNNITVDAGDKSYLKALGYTTSSNTKRDEGDLFYDETVGDPDEDTVEKDDGSHGEEVENDDDDDRDDFDEAFFDPNEVVNPDLDWAPNYGTHLARAEGNDSRSIAARCTDAATPSPTGKGYIAPVSPWFFTHYGAEVSYSKNWVFPSDLLLYLRWLEILALKPRFVEIVTWNDYGESHYVGPLSSKHTDDGASKWINDMPHTGWLDLSKPFIAAYKAGAPTPNSYITSDQIIYWYRITSKNLNCDSTDTTMGNANNASGNYFRGRPDGYQTMADNVFVVSLLTSPGTVTVNSGGTLYTYAAPQGASAIAVPFKIGAQRFVVVRNGKEVVAGTSLKVVQNTCPCGLYNFNPYVGVVPDPGRGRDVLQPDAYGMFANGLKVGCAASPSLPATPPATTAASTTVVVGAAPTTPPV